MTMTTIKRTIVILFLLAIAFFIYRGISPSGAERLIARIKNISTMFVTSGTVSSGTAVPLTTGQFLEVTGEDMVSGTVAQTGFIDILSGADTGVISTGGSLTILTGSSSGSTSLPTGAVTKPSSSSTTSKGLSSKDIQDTKAISNLFK